METLLILTYAAICYVLFRVLKIPLTKWTVPTAVIGGVFLIGFILLAMNYNHPFSSMGRSFYHTTPITPNVQGRVTEVRVQPNSNVNQGDVLFQIDPRPFQDSLIRAQAQLAAAEQGVKELKAALDGAEAAAEEAKAARDRAKDVSDRYTTGNTESVAQGRNAPFTQIEVENRREAYLESEAAYTVARAAIDQARLAYEAQINGVNTSVAELRAAVDRAQFELDSATVRAPTDGYVTQVFLRPGMMTVPFPITPVLSFIHADKPIFAAAFPQNALQRIEGGEAAEFAFDAVPGRVFSGKVSLVQVALAEGQLQPIGHLIDASDNMPRGRAIVLFDLDADLTQLQLPAGASAQVAVYSDHWRPFAIIRKILIRMRSWQNYVFR